MRKLFFHITTDTKKAIRLAALAFLLVTSSAFGDQPKIVYINSYHAENPWSMEMFQAFKQAAPDDIELIQLHMNTSLLSDISLYPEVGQGIYKQIINIQPDIIVAADDNASKYVVQPYFKNSDIPVIFLGVNVDGTDYNYPYKNTTGIFETYNPSTFLKLRSLYFSERKPIFIFANTTTSLKKLAKHREILGIQYPTVLVDDLDSLEKTIKKFPSRNSVFIFDTFRGLKGFDNNKIKEFISEQENILVASLASANEEFSHFIFGRSPREQGKKAAAMLTELLGGEKVSAIEMQYGTKFKFTMNKEFFVTTNTRIPEGLITATTLFKALK